MTEAQILKRLTTYVAEEILEGEDDGLDGQSPLLEWGVLNSIEIVRLQAFILETFEVEISSDLVTPEHFATLDAITRLVASKSAAS